MNISIQRLHWKGNGRKTPGHPVFFLLKEKIGDIPLTISIIEGINIVYSPVGAIKNPTSFAK
jgi:hypothetical protein